jgi:hypothetical protein
MSAGGMLLVLSLIASGTPEHGAHAERASAAPVIDGDLSDVAWLQAHSISGFTQRFPNEAAAPTGRTDVRILYDDHALYFAFHCLDPEPTGVVARLTRRDYDSASDGVIIDLDTRGDHVRAFHFEVNAAGVQRDAIRTGDSAISYDWNAVWESAVRQTADGWTAEIAIPFSALRYEHAPRAQWLMQIKRYVSRLNETDQWIFVPQTENEMLRYGVLSGLDRLPEVHGVVLNPFVTGRVRLRNAPAVLAVPRGLDGLATAGIDGQVGLTSSLSLQATVLPDFAQVEADPAVLNLSTFELHLDEKRPFFLEGADLFQLTDPAGRSLGDQLFYSRRLGSAAPGPHVPTGATVVEAPEVTPLWSSAKLTGRVGDRLTIAVLDGLAARDEARVRMPDGTLQTEGVAPLSNFFVGRLRAPIAGDFTAGLSVTSVARQESPRTLGIAGVCPDGTLYPADGRCTNDEQAVAADVLWQPKDGQYAASAMFFGSRTAGGPTRQLGDGTSLASGDLGFGARAQVSKTSGNLVGNVSFETLSPKLDLNAAGYQPDQNYRWVGADASWRSYNFGPVLQHTVTLGGSQMDTWRGLLRSRSGFLSTGFTFRNQWSAGLSGGAAQDAFDPRETGTGVAVQRPAALWGSIWASSNPTRPVTFGSWTGVHTTWHGYGVGGGLGLNLKLLNRLEISLAPNANWNTGDPRHVATNTGEESSSYVFGLQDAFSAGTTLRSTFTFTPTITLQSCAQVFFAAVRYEQLYAVSGSPDLMLRDFAPVAGNPHGYDSRSAVVNISLVFRWEYLPGSTLYVVYTRSQNGGGLPMPTAADGSVLPARDFDVAALARGQTEDIFLAKLSYHWGN